MGAACGKVKTVDEPKSRKAPVEVSKTFSPNLNTTHPEAEPDKADPPPPVKEFVTGEGDGLYLMLVTENNTESLVQQYAHDKPTVGENDCLYLQIKPPVYVPIKESRFVLQNGKRVLKMGIQMAMKTAEGQKKVCEAVMECLKLTAAYSAYIHCYPEILKAPFSVFLVVKERHEPEAVKKGEDGIKFIGELKDGGEEQKEKVSTEKTTGAVEPEPKTDAPVKDRDEASPEGKENVDEDDAEEGGSETDEKKSKKKTNEPGRPSIFMDGPTEAVVEVPPPKTLEQYQVLRQLTEGRSPNFSLMVQIIVLPLPCDKAQDALKDGRVVGEGDMEALKKKVEKLNGAMLRTATEQVA